MRKCTCTVHMYMYMYVAVPGRNEHYSIVYFNCNSKHEILLRVAGAHTCTQCVDASIVTAFAH